MANRPDFLTVLHRVQFALNQGNFPDLNFKPAQIKCLEFLLNRYDVIGVLPTGFGKSMIFHFILPHLIPVKTRTNIVIVVCPLNSIIEDQLGVLRDRNIAADVIQVAANERKPAEDIFEKAEPDNQLPVESDQLDVFKICNNSIIFAHPEALLSKEGRKLMGSKIFQDNVVDCVVDEAHCVELWGEELRKDFQELSVLKAFFSKCTNRSSDSNSTASAIESRVVNSGIDLKSLIDNALAEYEHEVSSDCSLLYCMSIDKHLADSIVKQVEYIETELDLLNDFEIWDEVCSSKILSLISKNTMLCVKQSQR